MIYNKFINCSTLDIFNKRKEAGDIIDQHIVFIQDVKQIWTAGVFYAAPDIDLSPEDLVKINEILDKIKLDGNGDKYLTDNGEYKSLDSVSVGTASKLGSSTIGSGIKPIYLDSGSPISSTSTVGSESIPVYMENGSITQCGDILNVSITGNAATADHADVADKIGNGGAAQTIGSSVNPVYVNNGVVTRSDSSVGSTSKPTYLNSGSITQCGDILNVSITGNAATSTSSETSRNSDHAEVATSATYVTRDRGSNSVTTLKSLPIDKSLVVANLSSATSISLSSNLNIGESITIICNPSADFIQPIPNTGGYISMDGDSLNIKSGKQFEVNIYCYGDGKYSISSKIKK